MFFLKIRRCKPSTERSFIHSGNLREESPGKLSDLVHLAVDAASVDDHAQCRVPVPAHVVENIVVPLPNSRALEPFVLLRVSVRGDSLASSPLEPVHLRVDHFLAVEEVELDSLTNFLVGLDTDPNGGLVFRGIAVRFDGFGGFGGKHAVKRRIFQFQHYSYKFLIYSF